MTRRQVIGLALLLLAADPAAAQDRRTTVSRRVALDTVVGSQDFFREDSDWQTVLIVDTFSSVELWRGWQVSLRPVVKRIRGEWDTYLDQISVRYEFKRQGNWRIEAGRFPSSIGAGLTEQRPNLNGGVLWWHRPYYMPLPSFGGNLPRVSLVSAVYPNGAQVSTSRDRWDARAAVVDRAPVEFWRGWAGSSRGPNGIVGFGVTPRQGVRLGLASAWGGYAASTPERPAQRYAMVNAEGEFAVGYTKIGGEWTRDRFETPEGDRVASGWTAQVQQTLTPRLFAHSRTSFIRSPEASSSGGAPTPRRFWSVETTLGYRVSPEITLRVAHAAIKSFTAPAFDHQIGVSIIFARRWW